MLHVGLDLSRKRLDVCLLSDEGELVGELAVPPDLDGLHRLGRRPVPDVGASGNAARRMPEMFLELDAERGLQGPEPWRGTIDASLD